MLMYRPQTCQLGFVSNIITKIHPHFKILDPRLTDTVLKGAYSLELT